MSLRPWQQSDRDHLLGCLAKHGAAVDMSDCGVGKTWTATAIAASLNKPTLVVCPKAVIPTWHRVAAALGTEFDVLNYEKLRTGNTPYLSFGVRNKLAWNPAVECLIFDEAHRCGGWNTLQADMLIAAKRQRIPSLLLSATLADSPLELRAAGYALGLHDLNAKPSFQNPVPRSFWSWALKHGCRRGAFSVLEFGGTPEKQAANMARINADLIPERGVRTRIADLGDEFPKTQITAELYGAANAGEVNRWYAEMHSALEALGQRTAAYGESPLSTLIEARQRIELVKVPVMVELAQDAIAQGMSVALFVNFRATVDELCARLKTECRVDGSQTGPKGERERQAFVDAFQADAERVIVCNNEAGGVGLSLHDLTGRHPRLALHSPGYSAKVFRQALHRVYRLDGKSASLQRAILLAGTVEEPIAKVLNRKSANLDALLDSDLMPPR